MAGYRSSDSPAPEQVRAGRDTDISGGMQSYDGAAGVQAGSANVQINYFYGDPARTDAGHSPVPKPGTAGPIREIDPAVRPVGGRVCAADPRRLGVHAAISVPGVPDDVPPEYVPRDVDVAGHGVRATVSAAAQRGGFVLLVGGSSVGKTRCAVEAVQAVLPDWWLVHPAGPAEVTALAQAPPPRMVVWLDELQRYLDGPEGLTGAVVRAMLNGPACGGDHRHVVAGPARRLYDRPGFRRR
jgi:hypothetical protein